MEYSANHQPAASGAGLFLTMRVRGEQWQRKTGGEIGPMYFI
jgi:hypothetical protein